MFFLSFAVDGVRAPEWVCFTFCSLGCVGAVFSLSPGLSWDLLPSSSFYLLMRFSTERSMLISFRNPLLFLMTSSWKVDFLCCGVLGLRPFWHPLSSCLCILSLGAAESWVSSFEKNIADGFFFYPFLFPVSGLHPHIGCPGVMYVS